MMSIDDEGRIGGGRIGNEREKERDKKVKKNRNMKVV